MKVTALDKFGALDTNFKGTVAFATTDSMTVPLSFRILALRSIEISVQASLFRGPGKAFIPAACLDIRVVRAIKAAGDRGPEVLPLLAESFTRVRLAPRSLTRIWITYFVPEGTPPGTYRGKLVIRSGAGRRQEVSVELEVYPFQLLEPDTDFYLYTESTDDPSVFARELADQRLHGMNMGMVHPPVTRAGELVRDAMTGLLATYDAAGLPRKRVFVPLENRITAEWLNDPDKTIGMWGPWMRYYPLTGRLDRRYVEAVKFVRDEAARRGIRVVLAVGDEAGSHAWTIPPVRHYLELVKREVPDVVRELTVGGGWAGGVDENAEWKGLLDIWTTNRWLADRIDRVRKEEPGASVAVYNMGGAGSKPGGLTAARALLDEIAAATELNHEDYDAVSGGRIHAAPPGKHEEWRARLAEAIVRLDSEKRGP